MLQMHTLGTFWRLYYFHLLNSAPWRCTYKAEVWNKATYGRVKDGEREKYKYTISVQVEVQVEINVDYVHWALKLNVEKIYNDMS